MINKQVLPESFDFGMPSVELIGVGSKGLDKTAMVKRASAFDDVLDKIEKKANRTYLHVITTGAFEKYGANANCCVAGTYVLTNGKKTPIEDIKCGDLVLTKEGDYKKVIRTISREYAGELVQLKVGHPKLDYIREETVQVTPNHPIFIVKDEATKEGDFVEAKDVAPGNKVLIPNRDDIWEVLYVCIREPKNQPVIFYNLEVEDSHTYCIPFATHNCDAYNGHSFEYTFPYPENEKKASVVWDGGLSKYHDDTYMKDGAVYQEHQTKSAGVQPSGEVIAARYNDDMERGELIIAVDNDKWRDRLQKKASGHDIYLSIGCSVDHDRCLACGHIAKVASDHCTCFQKHRGQLLKSGTVIGVMNDAPHFYDISGVNVPADKIAFVLRKMASVPGTMEKEASLEAITAVGTRRPMLFTKAAAILSKLAEMEKQVQGLIEGDKDIDLEAFRDNDDEKKNLILRVETYPADEVIDSCNRKGILLSPGMLFKLLGSDLEDADNLLSKCDDSSCGDMSCMMRELEEDEDRNDELLDGSFDQHFPADLNLDDILNKFLPEFGASNPAIQAKVIRITVSPRKHEKQEKKASFNSQAEQALRKTYARYLISFAERNDDATCMNALMKIAALGK